MAALTRAQVRALQSMRADLAAARDYLMRGTTMIGHAGTINAAVPQGEEYRQARPFERKHYVGRDGSEWDIDFIRTVQPVAKEGGSDLVRLFSTIRALDNFIEANTRPTVATT